MKDPKSQTVFAGVDGLAEAQLPNWHAEERPDDNPLSFAEAIRSLPRASEATVAYRNPHTGEWIKTDRFNAIVEPSRLHDQALGDNDVEPLLHVPSVSYTILNPVDVYGPLEDVLREEVVLCDVVFG